MVKRKSEHEIEISTYKDICMVYTVRYLYLKEPTFGFLTTVARVSPRFNTVNLILYGEPI